MERSIGLGTLPIDMQRLILLDLSAGNMLNLCEVNKAFAKICSEDDLWRRKLERDFFLTSKPTNRTWKQTYIDSAKGRLREVPFTHRGYQRAKIWIEPEMKEQSILDTAKALIPDIDVRVIVVYGGHSHELPIHFFDLEEPDTPSDLQIKDSGVPFEQIQYIEAGPNQPTVFGFGDGKKSYAFWFYGNATVGDLIAELQRTFPNVRSVRMKQLNRVTGFGFGIESLNKDQLLSDIIFHYPIDMEAVHMVYY